jgi:hypothetical protein
MQDKCKMFPEEPGEEQDPGCFCPGPHCVFDDEQGFFGWATAKQLAWENENLMRRQTLPGLSDALRPDPEALRHATVRLPRLQQVKGKEAATLDPRPPMPVENPLMPGMRMKDLPKIKPYEAPTLLGNLGSMVGNELSEALVGANMLEMKAFMRLQNQTNGEWMENLIKYKRALEMHKSGEEKAAHDLMLEGKEEQAVIKKRKRKRELAGLVDEKPEPLWEPPPPQRYKDLYEMRYRKFWPAMEVLARRTGSGSARLVEDLGKEWRAARLPPSHRPNALHTISESAGSDIRAAKHALGGPSGREEEEIDAVDLVLPVPQPEIRQARPMDLGAIPTATRPANMKAYIAKGAPPKVEPAALEVDGLRKQLLETRETRKDLKSKMRSYQKWLDVHKDQEGDVEKMERKLLDAQKKDDELREKNEAVMSQIDGIKNVLAGRYLQMHPAGRNGVGVETKVPSEMAAYVSPLGPPEASGAPTGQTTYAAMGPLGATAGAVLLSSARSEMQLLVHDERLARWRSSRRRGRRRGTEETANFI